MKKIVMAAAMFASTIASANAAVIVQHDSDGDLFGMNSFDSRLGRLTRVTFEINFAKSRSWAIIGEVAPNTSVNYAYVVDGIAGVSYYDKAAGNWDILNFRVFGEDHGTKKVSDPNNDRFIETYFSGRAIFDLNPLSFIDTAPQKLFFNASDPYYYGGATDTDLRLSNGYSAVQAPGFCGGSRSGEDFCGNAYYTLTYSYIPKDNPAVPEPGTWMMMILGFGAVGYTMRRKTVLRFV